MAFVHDNPAIAPDKETEKDKEDEHLKRKETRKILQAKRTNEN